MKRKLLYSIISLFLAVLLGIEPSLNALAVGEYADSLYISDVMIGTGKTPEIAQKALTDQGFTVYGPCLNGEVDTNGKWDEDSLVSYLGYKTTTDRNKAITSLKVMDEQGGYIDFDYKQELRSQQTGLAETVASLRAACTEFGENLRAGMPNAVLAKSYLDIFCVPKTSKETEGTLLSDWLTDPKRTDSEYEEFLLITSAPILAAVNAQLTLAALDSRLLETKIGETGIVSQTGVVGYAGLTEDPQWASRAWTAFTDRINAGDTAADIGDEDIGWMDCYGDQIYLLRKALTSDFSETAIRYLQDTELTYLKAAPEDTPVQDEVQGPSLEEADMQKPSEEEADTQKLSFYDFLSQTPDALLAMFLEELPEVCNLCHFTDVIEICAADPAHRIPTELKTDYAYEVNWIENILPEISNLDFDPYNADARTKNAKAISVYSDNISKFIFTISNFFQEYYKAANVSDNVTAQEGINVYSQTEAPDPTLFLRAYEFLNSFSIGEGKTLATYLEEIYKNSKQNTSEGNAIASALTYFIVRAMTPGQIFGYRMNAFLTFVQFSFSTEKELAVLSQKRNTLASNLLSEVGTAHFSVWYNTDKELLETDFLAVTNETTRRLAAESGFKDATKNDDTSKEKIWRALTAIGYSAAIWGTVAMFAFSMGHILLSVNIFSAIGVGFSSIFGAAGASTIGAMFCIGGAGLFIALIVLGLTALFLYIAYCKESKEKRPEVYSPIPTIMMDSKEKKNEGRVLYRYDVVRDQDGEPADLNCKHERKWNALYYSKDPTAGSPLTADRYGNFFGYVVNSTSCPSTAVPLTRFGELSAYDLNTHTLDDDWPGIYLWYYTEASLSGEKEVELDGLYIDTLMISIAQNEEAAINGVLQVKGFHLLNYDLAPGNDDYFVYLGYSTTDMRKDAARDIRVAYGTTNETILYGGTKYTSIHPKGSRDCPLKTNEAEAARRTDTPFSYSIYKTSRFGGAEVLKEDDFGPAIYADSLKVATSLSDIPDGAEPITMFGGGPFDFNSWDDESTDTFTQHVYVYYQTDQPFTSKDEGATEYLAGIGFFTGSTDYYDSDSMDPVADYAKESGYSLFYHNLTPGLLNNYEDVTYMAYYTTYNKYRAMTDLGIFTSEPKNGYLPDNMSAANVGYEVCPVYTQADSHYYAVVSGRKRAMRRSHAYITGIEYEGRTHVGDEMLVQSRGLFASGYQTGIEPLTPNDVVISVDDKSCIPTQEGQNRGLTTLCAMQNRQLVQQGNSLGALGAGWKTVHPLDQYFYDSYSASGDLTSSFNMGLGKYMGEDANGNDGVYESVFCMYVRNPSIPNRIRGNYVMSAQIVSSHVANSSYDACRLQAMAMGEEIINLDAPIRTISASCPDLLRESPVIYDQAPATVKAYEDGCFLIAVSYTNAEVNALGSIRVLEQQEGDGLSEKSTLSLLLDEYSQCDYSRGNLAALMAEEEKDETITFTDEEKRTKENQKTGIVFYSTRNGIKINRLLVQQISLYGLESGRGTWHENPDGVAEYYLLKNNTLDPYSIFGYGSSLVQYICARRYDTKPDVNDYLYVESLQVASAASYDGQLHASVPILGGKDYPFYLNYDMTGDGVGSTGVWEKDVVGIRRTGVVGDAVKDIKISTEDYGESFIYNDLVYTRANAKPMQIGSHGTESVFLYFTADTGGVLLPTQKKITWQELWQEPNRDWSQVDWRLVDLSTLDYSTFQKRKHVTGSFGTETWKLANDRSLSGGLDAAKFAITNVGVLDDDGEVIWAGKEKNGVLLNPVADDSTLFTVKTFDGSELPFKMVYVNTSNQSFDDALSKYRESQGMKGSGSVFAQENGKVILILLGIIVLAAVLAVQLAKKRKKSEPFLS